MRVKIWEAARQRRRRRAQAAAAYYNVHKTEGEDVPELHNHSELATARRGEDVQPFSHSTELAAVFEGPTLVVTREIEWGNLVFGYEQANRYTVLDEEGNVVAYLAEETSSFASAIGRQLLRTRRHFTATLLTTQV